MDKNQKISLYIKGYEEGQKEAWTDIKRLIKRHDGWDLRSRIESKLGTLYQDLASKRAELMDDPALLGLDEREREEPQESDEVDWDEAFYLIIEDKPSKSMLALKELVENGYQGLCISNQFPNKLKKKYELPDENITYIQLQKSNFGSDKSCIRCSPNNLTNISTKIGGFIEKHSPPAIVLHGVHSLTLTNEINTVLSFIEWIKDRVHKNDGFLLTSISNSDFTDEEIGKFKGYFDEVIYDG